MSILPTVAYEVIDMSRNKCNAEGKEKLTREESLFTDHWSALIMYETVVIRYVYVHFFFFFSSENERTNERTNE
jgi:hypothetical protein